MLLLITNNYYCLHKLALNYAINASQPYLHQHWCMQYWCKGFYVILVQTVLIYNYGTLTLTQGLTFSQTFHWFSRHFTQDLWSVDNEEKCSRFISHCSSNQSLVSTRGFTEQYTLNHLQRRGGRREGGRGGREERRQCNDNRYNYCKHFHNC